MLHIWYRVCEAEGYQKQRSRFDWILGTWHCGRRGRGRGLQVSKHLAIYVFYKKWEKWGQIRNVTNQPWFGADLFKSFDISESTVGTHFIAISCSLHILGTSGNSQDLHLITEMEEVRQRHNVKNNNKNSLMAASLPQTLIWIYPKSGQKQM